MKIKNLREYFRWQGYSVLKSFELVGLAEVFGFKDQFIEEIEKRYEEGQKVNYKEMNDLAYSILKSLPEEKIREAVVAVLKRDDKAEKINAKKYHEMNKKGYVLYSRGNVNEEIDVLYGSMDAGYLLEFDRKDEGKLALELNYSIGDLTELYSDERNLKFNVLDCIAYPLKDKGSFKEIYKEVENELKQYKKITIWSAHKDADMILLTYYFINRFYNIIKDKDIGMVYIDDEKTGKKVLDELTEEQFKDLLKSRKVISKEEIENYKNKWDEIVAKKTDLRRVENGKITYHDAEEYKDEVLRHVKDGMLYSDLIQEVMKPLNLKYEEAVYVVYRLSQKGYFSLEVREGVHQEIRSNFDYLIRTK